MSNTYSSWRCVLVLSLFWLCPEVFAGDEVFSITPMDRTRNTYAELRHEFKQSTVHYDIGELWLVRGTTHSALPFRFRSFFVEYGSTQRGVDPVLSNLYKTESFVPIKGDSLSFYRAAFVDPRQGAIPASDWESVVGDIKDTSSVYIRVEDEGDTTLFAIIDSVVVYPNPTSTSVKHSGTRAEVFMHKRAIPASLWGKTVRIRLVVKRSGDSPLGLIGTLAVGDIAYSAWRTPAWSVKISESQMDSLQKRSQWLQAEFHKLTGIDMQPMLPIPGATPVNDDNMFTAKIAMLHYQGGLMTLAVHIPPSTTDLTWHVSNPSGAVLRSGLIWPPFRGDGQVVIPYLPYMSPNCSLTLTDNQSGITRSMPIAIGL